MKLRLLAAGLFLGVSLAVLAWLNQPRYTLEDLLGARRLAASQWLDEGGPQAQGLLRRGLTHPDPRVRARCLNSLDRVSDAQAVPGIVALLQDPDLNVRAMAARTLIHQRGWPSAEPLLAALRAPGQEPRIRVYLLDALSQAKTAEVVPDLVAAAANRSATLSERMMGVQGLQRMRVSSVRPLLTTILLSPEEPSRLRGRAGMALGRCGAFDVLLSFLSQPGQDDRALAGAAHGFSGSPPTPEAQAVLMTLARSAATPPLARLSATRVLLKWEVEVPTKFLGELLLHHEEREIRKLAAELIPLSPDEEVWDALFEAQETERSGEVRRTVNAAIGRLP